MKKIFISLLCALPLLGFGQNILFYNDGAMVKVQAGATLYIQGGMQNTATGTIDNDGTIDIEGNFVNAGTWEPSQPNTLRFSGTGASDVTSGPAQFQTVEITKNGNNVNLLDPMTVNTDLNFNSAGATNINIGNFNLNIGGTATVTGADINEFVVTNGTGKMKKSYTALGSFDFPVGFNSSTYNPATINVTAGPNDTYGVRVLASPTDGNGLTGTPITADVVDAVWDVAENTVGGNTADITLGWSDPSDELPGFDDNSNCVSLNDGVNGWDGLFANLGPENPSNFRTRTGLTSFGAFAVGDKSVANNLIVNAKAFLQGPYLSGLMVDSLRVHNYIPLSEPYSTLPSNPYVHHAYGGGETVTSNAIFDQPGTNDDIVDWIIVELRSSGAPTMILADKTGLIQRDGSIVDLDGSSPLTIPGLADGSYYIGLRHRNHLGVRTNATVSLSNTPSSLIDFTALATAFDDPSITKPTDPMKLLTGSTYGLWSGDANFNQEVGYNGANNDKNIVLGVVGLTTPNNVVAGYNRADINMNGYTLYNGAGNDKNLILANVGLTTPNDILKSHNNN